VDVWHSDDAGLPPADAPVLTATFFDGGEWSRGIAVTLSQGVRVAWSPRLFVEPSGRPVRTYVPLALDNGVGTWRTRWKAGQVMLHAEVGKRRILLSPLQSVADDESPGRALVPEVASSCAHADNGDITAQNLRDALQSASVRDSAVTKIRALWCGRVGSDRATLVGVSTDDGTDFQMLTENETHIGGGSGATAMWPVPPGRGLDYPVARELSLPGDRSGPRSTVVVVAPGAVTVELQQGDPLYSFARQKVDADGFALLNLSESDTYRWRDAQHPPLLVTRDARGRVADGVSPTEERERAADELDGPEVPTDASPVG
jgi:hypothetical protein